ncbi:oligosaccharide transporter [Siminovitchia terrae]|uniref:Oligosaccharide transporter n=1 Tax=Siminovitchia terrae TaxID=1914933 RepID=A0A429X9I5_SIMTE|nr:oligosaccharide flippase family protein [Siminovitchia terrae]RST60064.1 hypothetical protein D5F11_008340 [Siminovitchia terrae]GIN92572.1 oligosaccharide transporter [Siminovitchia terrae]GIN97394.1 oligosaccharide transporter [Siminovitchia terrae]
MNTQARTHLSLKNLSFALVGQFLSIIISVIARIVFVRTLSTEYLGLDGLFTNVISILSLVELGIGPALVYSLYKPIAEKDIELIKSLMKLYQKAYLIIGSLILLFGITVTPFIQFFIKDIPDIPYLHFIFLLFVCNAAITYFYSYKRSLIIADQRKYIDSTYRYSSFILLNIFQCIVLIMWKNFILFVICQLIFTLIENILVSRAANKLYPFLKHKNVAKLNRFVLKGIYKNVKAMAMHRIGTVIVLSTDNILISSYVGLVAVGLYSNYRLILAALNIVLIQFFEALKSSVGNFGVTESQKKTEKVFRKIFFMNFWLYGFAAVGLLCTMNPLIEIWLGKKFIFSMDIVLLIVIHFFLGGMRQAPLTFRDALGLYWYDRYKPIAESIINLVVSIILLKMMGISGIFLGTIFSLITTCFWVEPYVLYKYGFNLSSKSYFITYIKYTSATVLAGLISYGACNMLIGTTLLIFVSKILITITVTNTLYYLIFRKTEEYLYFKDLVIDVIQKLFLKKKLAQVKNFKI